MDDLREPSPLPEETPSSAKGEAPSVEEALARLGQALHVADGQQIVHVEVLPASPPCYADPSPPLPDPLRQGLERMGIPRLYSHQVEALERVRRGENVVVVTGTSSGKTLCYNLPILERILQDRTTHALYLYPVNALINDQLKGLFRLNLALGKQAVGIARYTGALNSEQRQLARARSPHIWLTNPEMLHLSFLLWHQNWEELWRNLRFIVLDEVHTYRGVFGANMAHLLRRVLRMAAHYGASPQFICCSATIANPRALAETLTGRPFTVVDRDGAGKGRRFFVLWNPPLQGEQGANLRRSYAEEAVDLLLHCVRLGYNTIVFARARSLTERMLRLGRNVEARLAERISSYRAGYLAEEREEIEGKLKTGVLQGIITTNALELGIDIGGLDAAIIAGYPGTIMSTWQQAGRAGRRGRDALILLVASQNPLDQYYVNHPREFFAQPHELAIVDLNNQTILLKHLLCAARELPLLPAEIAALPPAMGELIAELRQEGLLVPATLPEGEEGLTYPPNRREIHLEVALRSASHETYRILDENRNEVGTIEPPNVFREAHPGAIYQHGGDDYRVVLLDRKQKIVHVREEQAPHYTRASSTLSLKLEEVYATREQTLGNLSFTVALGDVLVEETIRGYQELRLGSDELVKKVNLDYPLVLRLHTTAMWCVIPKGLAAVAAQAAQATSPEEEDKGENTPLAEGLHAMQHLLTGVLPLLVMCDRRDIDGFYHVAHPDLGLPAVFVYDAYEGGIGLAEVAYQRITELLRLAYDTVAGCRCQAGCPSCIQSGVCRLRNEALNKAAAKAILARLTGVEAVPDILREEVPAYAAPAEGAPGAPLAARTGLSARRALAELLERTRRAEIFDRVAFAAQAPPEPRFAPGDVVEQSPYGRGVVLSSRIEGQREIVQVRFWRRNLVKELDASKTLLRKVS